MTLLRWLCWLPLASLWSAPLPPMFWRIDRATSADNPALQGLQLAVLTATQTDQDLLLRVGIFNTTKQSLAGSAELKTEDVTLLVPTDQASSATQATTVTLTNLFGRGTLAPHAVHTGVLTFPCGRGEVSLEGAGALIVHVQGFRPLMLALDDTKQFTPVDWTIVQKRSPLQLNVKPRAEAVAIFPMRLHSLTVQPEFLELTLSFNNAARFPVTWKGTLNGGMSALFTPSGERLSALDVSASLRDRIAPKGSAWHTGEDNLGWVRYPLPHAHEGHQLTFVMPGYERVRLIYDAGQRQWLPSLPAHSATAEPTTVDHVLAEERTFAELKRLWQQMARDMTMRRQESFLGHFSGKARQDQQSAWPAWLQAPVSDLVLRMPEAQRVMPDAKGRLQNVEVEMTYTLASLPKENVFVTSLQCDLQRSDSGVWRVEAIDYQHGLPFWLIGYTQMQNSRHFLVLHRADEDEVQEAQLALKQLEKAYGLLAKLKLPLKNRYVAFAVSRKADFQALTNRDPETYAGAASSAYTRERDRIRVLNQALYLNDYRFFTLQRAWGKQDRQTTIQHELVHLALADLTRPWTPAWLVEGIAMHYAEQCDSFTREALRQVLSADTSLMSLSRLAYLGVDTKDGARIMMQYQLSGEAVQLIVKRYGIDSLLRLYGAYASFIPDEWENNKDEDAKHVAAARERVAGRVLAQQFGGLTLEQLDSQVRLRVLR